MSQLLKRAYDDLWDVSQVEVRSGFAELDAKALSKAADARRGVTLLARLAPSVAQALANFMAELQALEPDQYYQPLADLHLTVLSLFTATENFDPFLANIDVYRAAATEATRQAEPFRVKSAGVTLARGAVLAQGFPDDGMLAMIRDALRAALAASGLGGDLDRRYRLGTAHTTIVRFAAPLRDPVRFVEALKAARERPFGVSTIDRLELVLGDWYQSSERERLLSTYALRQ